MKVDRRLLNLSVTLVQQIHHPRHLNSLEVLTEVVDELKGDVLEVEATLICLLDAPLAGLNR